MRRRDLLTGSAALALSAGAAHAFGIGELGAGLGDLGVLGGAGVPSWAAPGSLFGLDFANSRYWPQPLANQTSFSRASVGEADNISGAWSQFLSGVARITNKGLRYEPGRTNSIRNNSGVGASAGVAPTNWTNNGPNSGVSITFGAPFVANGITFVPVTFAGTATANNAVANLISLEAATAIAAATGQTWSYSSCLNSSGVVPQIIFDLNERSAGSGILDNTSSAMTVNSTIQRLFYTVTLSGGVTTAFVLPRLYFSLVSGTVYTGTLNIGLPQAELGASVTSPIVTSGAASARLADVLALIRSDIGRIVFTFSDGTTQTVSGITKGSPYTVPTTLNEQVIARMDGYAS